MDTVPLVDDKFKIGSNIFSQSFITKKREIQDFSSLGDTLMDIIYCMADFEKNNLIVLTVFPLKLKNK